MILTTRPHGRLAALFGPLLVAGIALGVAADVAINAAEHVSGWTFPGVTSAGISHFHLVEPAS
jgi:hypothetical protein